MSEHKFAWLGRILTVVVLIILIVYAVFPIIWTLLCSFKNTSDIITPVPKVIFRPTLNNYAKVLVISEISHALLVSLVVSLCSVVLGFILGTPFAYVVARFNFKGRENIKFWIITLRMIPPVATVFAFVFLWIKTGLIDTPLALIVTYLLITTAAIIWLSVEPFRNVPIEMEEAAQLEGCSPVRVFLAFALPVAWPNLLGGVLFSFILVWNEFFLAFALTSKNMTVPVAVGAYTIVGMNIDWGLIAALVILLSVPPLLLVGVFRKSLESYFVIKT